MSRCCKSGSWFKHNREGKPAGLYLFLRQDSGGSTVAGSNVACTTVPVIHTRRL